MSKSPFAKTKLLARLSDMTDGQLMIAASRKLIGAKVALTTRRQARATANAAYIAANGRAL